MIKAFTFLVIGFMLLLTVTIFIGIAGGVFGLIVGLIGGAVGLFFGLIGAIFGCIAGVFKAIFHVLFGWNSDFGFHHWHMNGYIFAALLVLIFVVASQKKK